ncbi:MAG: tetratricopeptide repeat protein [Phormidium sp.]
MLDTTKLIPEIAEKIDKIIPQADIDLSDPHLTISEFIGREEEINQLHQFLADNKKQLIGITGVGGMGKSTLAAKIYAETRFLQETGFLGQFWVDIFRNPEMRIFTGMARLVLRQFLHLPEDSPILKDEQNLPNRLLTCLQNNKYLLVIDNLETLLQDGQFQDNFYQQFFQDWLGYGGKSVILVTTQERWDVPSDNCVELTGFKPEAGATLLKVLGITGSEEGFQAFSQRVKGHPLSLKLVAGFLKEEEGENADISFLDRNPLQISGWHRSETVSVEEVLAASFNRLDERLKKLLLNVSVYRLRFNSLAAAAVMEEENVEKDLRLLVRKSLLQEERENRQWWFQFQPLVLEYVRGVAGDLKEAHERAIDYYKSQVKSPPWQNLEDITGYLEIFYHLCQLEQYVEAFATIYECVDRFLDLRGYNKLRVKIYTSLVDSWKPTDENEKGKFGAALISLGAAYNFLGKYQQAIRCHQQSLEIYRQIGNRSWEAASIGNLGCAYDSLGRYQEAIDYYQQALEICTEINYLNGVANSLGNLGSTYNSLGQYEQTIQYHQQSLEIRRKIGDRRGEANSLNGLGNAYNNLRQYQQAIDYYQQSLTIFKEIGDLHGEAVYLNNLGNVYRYLKEYEKGIDFHQQSLKIVSEIDDPKGQAECLGNIGRAYESLGQYHKAIEYIYQQLTIAREIGSRQEETAALNNLGTAYRSLGQYDQAIEFCKEALKIIRQLGNHENEAKCLTNLGYSYDSLMQYQQAIDYYEQALDIEQRTGNCQGKVVSLNNLGCAYYFLKQYQQAIPFYQQSLEIAQSIGDRLGEATAFGNLGAAYQSLGQYQEAIGFHLQSLEIKREIGDKRCESISLKNLSISYNEIGKIQEYFAAAYQAILILQELGLPLEAMPYPNWVKLIAKFAQRGKWQLALCFILGLFAFPFALVWIVLLMLWRVVRAQFRRRS